VVGHGAADGRRQRLRLLTWSAGFGSPVSDRADRIRGRLAGPVRSRGHLVPRLEYRFGRPVGGSRGRIGSRVAHLPGGLGHLVSDLPGGLPDLVGHLLHFGMTAPLADPALELLVRAATGTGPQQKPDGPPATNANLFLMTTFFHR